MQRIGIIGCGGIAQVHARALDIIENVQLVACADIVEQRARTLADQYKSVAIYKNYQEMLEKESLDAVHICTPHNLHIPMAIDALKHNISVFCEKPPAISYEQWNELKTLSLHLQKRVGFCFQNRYNATTKVMDELVSSKEYGKVTGGRAFVTWRRDLDYYSASPWKGRWETEGGGVLMNQAIHTLDLLLRYLGKPVKVEASLQNHHTSQQIEEEDTVEAWLEFAHNRRGCFYASNGYVTDAPVLLELQCEKGRLTLLEKAILIQTADQMRVLSCKDEQGMGKDYWGNGHLACIQDFYQCMEKNQKFQNDITGVENTVLTTLKIYKK